HYAQAEQWEKAQAYLVQAGDQAGRVAADAEALSHYRLAMEAYGRVFGDRWDPVERAVLERKIGEALMRRGENALALESLEQAIAHLGKPVHGTASAVRQANLIEIVIQTAHRLLAGRYEPGAQADFGQEVIEEGLIYMDMATITSRTNQEQFLFDVVRGLNFAERHRFALGICRGAAGLGLICDFIPIFSLARFYHNYAIRLAEQMQNPVTQGLVHYGYGIDQAIRGDYAPALECFLKASRYLQDAGDINRWGLAQEGMGQTMIYADQFQPALACADELVRVGQASAGVAPMCVCNGRMLQGMVERRTGQPEAAVSHLQEAMDLAAANPDYYVLAFAAGELGQAYLSQGHLEKGLEALELGQKTAREHGLRGNALTPIYNGLAQAYLLAAQRGPAQQRKEGLEQAGPACRTALGQGKAFVGGMPEAERLQGRLAHLKGDPKAALSWWQRSLASAEKLSMRYEQALTYLEIGQATGQAAALERAKSLFTEIGAVTDRLVMS
ncbi:MAG TPA: hypothetical protein VF823_11820, partial [Anaerolineales bacterium]